MKLILLSEDSIRLEPEPGPVTIEAVSANLSFSPFHMVAGGMAYCTFSIMYAWAEQAGVPADNLTLEIAWSFAEDPHRVASYDVRFNWPSLPPQRLPAAKRVAEMCTLHQTLLHPPVITVEGTVEQPSPVALTPPTKERRTA